MPRVVEAVRPLPVLAAGGIADGRGVVAALSLSAQAVSMGTRFVASQEIQVIPAYKQRIVDSTAEDTVHTCVFDVGWPQAAHRVLRNTAVAEWQAAGCPASGQRPGEGDVVGRMPMAGTTIEVPRYGIFPPLPGFEGDMEHTALYAGESCALIHDIKPAARIVADIVAEAERPARHPARLRVASQPEEACPTYSAAIFVSGKSPSVPLLAKGEARRRGKGCGMERWFR